MNRKSTIGGVIAILIIVVLLIAGAIYSWKNKPNLAPENSTQASLDTTVEVGQLEMDSAAADAIDFDIAL